ncbi:MAG: energy-coupling factor ABC transporter permease [Pseudomonadota bacterium]
MALLHMPVGTQFAWLTAVLFAPIALWALASVRGRFLPDGAAQHAWFAGIVCVAFLWSLPVKSAPGVQFGLLGVALFSLLFGRARAILGLVAALALHAALTGGAWRNFGLNGLLLAAFPAWTATALQRWIETRLPKNLFVFIIGNGLFVVLVTTAATSVAQLLVAAAVVAPSAAAQLGEAIGYALLLAWGEALASGMIFSALVIYRPNVVLTYRQDLYLPPRGR